MMEETIAQFFQPIKFDEESLKTLFGSLQQIKKYFDLLKQQVTGSSKSTISDQECYQNIMGKLNQQELILGES